MSEERVEESGQNALEPLQNHKEINPYGQLQNVETELDLVKCSEDIEDDLLEASLEEYQ